MFRTYIETTETNRIVSKRTETTRNCLKKTPKDDLSQTAAEGAEQVKFFRKRILKQE